MHVRMHVFMYVCLWPTLTFWLAAEQIAEKWSPTGTFLAIAVFSFLYFFEHTMCMYSQKNGHVQVRCCAESSRSIYICLSTPFV